jgi:uncharacterized protein (DUF2252 family)
LIVQASGDAHLLNFGGFCNAEADVVFDIDDLDETLPAPREWDVKRLTASIVIAGQHLRLSETESARAAEATRRGGHGNRSGGQSAKSVSSRKLQRRNNRV